MKPLNTNVNLLSYRGRSILQLLTLSVTFCNYPVVRENRKYLNDKLKMLYECVVDINKKDFKGNTISHRLIMIFML